MRPNFSCSACFPRSTRFILQGRVYPHGAANSFTRSRLRQKSTQTRKTKNIAGAAATNAKKGQKWTHASVATPKTGRPAPVASQDVRAASPEYLTPNELKPDNDLSSTRPALLVLPDGPAKDEGGSVTLKSQGSYFWQLGKAYAGLYKTGVKNIWSNYKEYRNLRRRFGGTNIHDLVKYASTPSISRREYQLYLRTEHDLKKLLPFGLVFAICGEFTPLVILSLGTSVVPYVCRIPKQVKKDLQKTLSRIENAERISLQREDVSTTSALAYVHGLDPFGLAIHKTPVLGVLLRRFWIEPKFKQRMDNIICDAILIIKEGGIEHLEPDELFQFGVNIKLVAVIKRVTDHHTRGLESHIPASDVKRTQKELQPFLVAIRRNLANQEKNTAGYDPEAIFVAASEYARSVGEAGPFIPPLDVKEESNQ